MNKYFYKYTLYLYLKIIYNNYRNLKLKKYNINKLY